MKLFLEAPSLSALPGIAHGFFMRGGGVSDGIYSSLNCGPGSKDNAVHIGENRARVAASLNFLPETLRTLYQVHSTEVISLSVGQELPTQAEADAMVTNQFGILLGILTADCVPVLFADAEAGVIGAAHAGWKGAFGGIVEETVKAMEKLGARRERIYAAAGPCIAQESYEVGPEFRERLVVENGDNRRFFTAQTPQGKCHFDLKSYVESKLLAAGVENPTILPHDTCTMEQDFFSYRRSTLRSEPGYGRQISCIGLTVKKE